MDKTHSYARIRRDGIDWHVVSGYARTIPEELAEKVRRGASYPECRIIRENAVRVSMLLPQPERGGLIFAKRYKCRGVRDMLTYLFLPSKAFSEWKIMHAFRERGIPVAAPLAYGEKRKGGVLLDSYLFTEGLAPSLPLRDFFEQRLCFRGFPDAGREEKVVIGKLAALVASIHAEGFFYRDLHAGNILVVAGAGGTTDLYPVDFHKVWHLGRMPDFMRIRDLAQLKNSLSLAPADETGLLEAYLQHLPFAGITPAESARRIEKKAGQLWRVHLKSRTRRCLVNSSEFGVQRNAAQTIYYRKTYAETLLADVLRHCGSSSPSAGSIRVKETPKEVVSCTAVNHRGGEIRVLIKEARLRSIVDRIRYSLVKTRAKRYWIAARGLQVRGVTTPDAIACVERRSSGLCRQTILLLEYLDQAYELNDYVLKRFNKTLSPQEGLIKKRFIEACALRLRTLHEKGIYHADLKSNNILVKEHAADAWEFYFIDLDRVSFCRRLSFRMRSNNLAQINASVAACITLSDRLHFFRSYARGTPLIREGKRYFQRIIQIGRGKNTLPYGLTFTTPCKQSTR